MQTNKQDGQQQEHQQEQQRAKREAEAQRAGDLASLEREITDKAYAEAMAVKAAVRADRLEQGRLTGLTAEMIKLDAEEQLRAVMAKMAAHQVEIIKAEGKTMLSLLDSYSKVKSETIERNSAELWQLVIEHAEAAVKRIKHKKEMESMEMQEMYQRRDVLAKELSAVNDYINEREAGKQSIEQAAKAQRGGTLADSPGGIGGGGAGGTGEISKMGNGIAMRQTMNQQAMNQVHRAVGNLQDTLDDVLPMCNERREARLALRLVEMWAWEALTHGRFEE